jgi:hypothetical protein
MRLRSGRVDVLVRQPYLVVRRVLPQIFPIFPIFSVVTPCRPGASTASVRRRHYAADHLVMARFSRGIRKAPQQLTFSRRQRRVGTSLGRRGDLSRQAIPLSTGPEPLCRPCRRVRAVVTAESLIPGQRDERGAAMSARWVVAHRMILHPQDDGSVKNWPVPGARMQWVNQTTAQDMVWRSRCLRRTRRSSGRWRSDRMPRC